MKTTDFSGTYDYEREEAKAVATRIIEDLNEGYYNMDQFHQAVIKERAHWSRILSDEGMKDFTDEFNKIIGHTGIYF